MKRGPITKKDQAVILHPNVRMGFLGDLHLMEDKILKIKNKLLAQTKANTDELLMVYNDLLDIHTKVRELASSHVPVGSKKEDGDVK